MGLATLTSGTTNVDLQTLLAGRDTRFWKGSLGRLNLICLLLIITMMTNGFDGSMMNNLQTLVVWKTYFNDPKGGTLGLFNAIQNIGSLAGLPFAPMLNDRIGRKKTIWFGASIMCVGVALQTASQNFGMFIGARALIGFGLSFALLAAPTLLTELAFPTHRAPLTSLFNCSWYVGSIIAAWGTFGTFHIPNNWAWRIPSLLQGIPSVLQVCLILFIPESPRWLVNKGKVEQARDILIKYHGNGDPNDALVEYEMNEIQNSLAIEREIEAESTWKSLFNNRGNLKRMRVVIAIGFFSQWSGNGLVSYYLNLVLDGVGITSTSQQLIFNGVLQFYNLGTGMLGALLVDKVGRRKLWLTSAAGMTISYTLWTIGAGRFAASKMPLAADGKTPLHPNKNAGNLVVAMIFFYYGFYNIAMSALLVSYTVEILPYRIRSKGLMVMQLCVSAALVLNQYANPIALAALDWKYYIVYTVWLAVEFVFLYFYIIETKGKNGILALEEIAMLFDGDNKASEVRTGAVEEMQQHHQAVEDYDQKKEVGGEHVERVERV